MSVETESPNNNRSSPLSTEEMDRREVLSRTSAQALNEFKADGNRKMLELIERELQEEAEELVKDELGLDDYQPPARFLIPKPDADDPVEQTLTDIHGKGLENGLYDSAKDTVVISPDYGLLNGFVENNIFSTAVHEVIHNDTYNRLLNVEEDLGVPSVTPEIDNTVVTPESAENSNLEWLEAPERTITGDLQSEYKLSPFELHVLSDSAKDKLSEISEEYKKCDAEEAEGLLEEAYGVVKSEIDVYHLSSEETQPEKEAFGWFASMIAEEDLEERRHLDMDFEGYEKSEEIQNELECLVGVYDNLQEHSEMEEKEILNYIFEEVQERKFDYKAKQIEENLT